MLFQTLGQTTVYTPLGFKKNNLYIISHPNTEEIRNTNKLKYAFYTINKISTLYWAVNFYLN